jgi:hypothetical protein
MSAIRRVADHCGVVSGSDGPRDEALIALLHALQHLVGSKRVLLLVREDAIRTGLALGGPRSGHHQHAQQRKKLSHTPVSLFPSSLDVVHGTL